MAAQHLPGCSSAVGVVSSALVLSEQAQNRALALAAAVRVSNWKMRGESASLWRAEAAQERRRSQPRVRWLLMCVENGPTLW